MEMTSHGQSFTACQIVSRIVSCILFCGCLLACGQSPPTLDDLIRDKSQNVQTSLAEVFNNAKANLDWFRETKGEIKALTDEKLKRLDSGESFDDLMVEDERFRSEVDKQSARSNELYVALVEDVTDFYGLLAAISSFCDTEVDGLIEAMNLYAFDRVLPDGVNAQTMFWNKKFEYQDVVAGHAENFSCDEKVSLINQIIEQANAAQDELSR